MSGKHVVVVGCGNIGSHLLPHLARMRRLEAVTIIDPDRYGRSNLVTQDIAGRDVGMPKATAQARRLRGINPALAVLPLPAAVESVPLGLLRADAILACLDSRAARQFVNEAAWRLGVPWIDAGVEGGGLLARVTVYVPGSGNACLECGWDDRDYAALGQRYSCAGAEKAPPSGSPSTLGALAASVQAIECAKLLGGERAPGREVLVDAAFHKLYLSARTRNSECRFDHRTWRIEPLAGLGLTLARALARGCPLTAAGRRFVRAVACAGCGAVRPVLRFEIPGELPRRCKRCGGAMLPPAPEAPYAVSAADVPRKTLAARLARLGIRAGDVIGLGAARFEITGERR